MGDRELLTLEESNYVFGQLDGKRLIVENQAKVEQGELCHEERA